LDGGATEEKEDSVKLHLY